MRYEIKYTCGHYQELFLYGKEEEREEKRKQLEQEMCNECKKQKSMAEAKIFKIERKLPDLKGTEKQRNWAESIRMDIIKKCEAALTEKGCNKTDKANAFLKWLSEKTSSVFWINKRNDKAAKFIEEWSKSLKG